MRRGRRVELLIHGRAGEWNETITCGIGEWNWISTGGKQHKGGLMATMSVL